MKSKTAVNLETRSIAPTGIGFLVIRVVEHILFPSDNFTGFSEPALYVWLTGDL